jgi:hypothetical protein
VYVPHAVTLVNSEFICMFHAILTANIDNFRKRNKTPSLNPGDGQELKLYTQLRLLASLQTGKTNYEYNNTNETPCNCRL